MSSIKIVGIYNSQKAKLIREGWYPVSGKQGVYTMAKDFDDGKDTLTVISTAGLHDVLPYRIVRPLTRASGAPITSAMIPISTEVEARSDFSIPAQLRVLYKTHRIDEVRVKIGEHDYALRAFTWMEGDNQARLREDLWKLRAGLFGDKSLFTVNSFYDELPKLADVWYDKQTATFFSFDKNFVNRIGIHLNAYAAQEAVSIIA